jgi:hypothetical protein
MTMSRLFLVVLVAGVFGVAPAASADVPNCDCLDDYDATWPIHPENCLFVCPGAQTDPGHLANQEADLKICLYEDQNCTVGLVGFSAMRLDMSLVLPDSICVCEEDCDDFPYIAPEGPTGVDGCTSFRFRGCIHQLEEDLVTAVDPVMLQVTGCQDRPVRFRSPDLNCDCVVGLADNVIFSGAFVICPQAIPPGPQPTGRQHYTVYTGHCAPCPQAQLSDNVVFSRHFDHTCTAPGSCDP